MGNRGEGRDKEKQKRYKDEVGSRGQGRGKEKQSIRFFLKRKIKRYEDQLGPKLEHQPFPGNGARKLVGYFNDANKSASARIPS